MHGRIKTEAGLVVWPRIEANDAVVWLEALDAANTRVHITIGTFDDEVHRQRANSLLTIIRERLEEQNKGNGPSADATAKVTPE